jgi:hypothetical protein
MFAYAAKGTPARATQGGTFESAHVDLKKLPPCRAAHHTKAIHTAPPPQKINTSQASSLNFCFSFALKGFYVLVRVASS